MKAPAELFRVLGNPERLEIYLFCYDKARTVNQIADRACLSQSHASHWIKMLYDAGLLMLDRTVANARYYRSVPNANIKGICEKWQSQSQPHV